MIEMYGIEGSSYDGCNGWSIWQVNKVFPTVKKAQDYIDKNLKDKYNRYRVIRIEIE